MHPIGLYSSVGFGTDSEGGNMTGYIVDWLVASVKDGKLWVDGVRVPKPRPETWAAIGTGDISGWLRVEYRPKGKVVEFYKEMTNGVGTSN